MNASPTARAAGKRNCLMMHSPLLCRDHPRQPLRPPLPKKRKPQASLRKLRRISCGSIDAPCGLQGGRAHENVSPVELFSGAKSVRNEGASGGVYPRRDKPGGSPNLLRSERCKFRPTTPSVFSEAVRRGAVELQLGRLLLREPAGQRDGLLLNP